MKKLLTLLLLLTSFAAADTHTKSSGGTPPYASGGTTVNVLCKSNGSSQCSDSSIVDNGAGAITIPGAIANQGTLTVSQLATPANATLVVTGGVGTNYTYKLVAKAGSTVTAANSGVSTAAGPTTLDGTHFIDINFVSQTGCTSIDVYRTVGGAAQGKIGNVACTTNGAALTLRDNALVGDASSAPSVNTTGGLISASLTEVPGTSVTSTVPLNLTQAASTTNAIVQFNSVATTGLMFGASTLVGLKVDTTNWLATGSTGSATIQAPSTGIIGWSSSTTFGAAASDTFLGREAAGIARIGLGANATPTARGFQIGEDSRGGTDSNVAGSSGPIKPGIGTGNGAGTKLCIQRNLMGASGSVLQTQIDGYCVGPSKTLSNTTATAQSLVNISVPSNSAGGVEGTITITCTDGTNFDSETQSFNTSFVNKATVLTVTAPVITATTAANNSGSCTAGITAVAGTNSVDIKVTPVFTTIVPTTVTSYIALRNNGTGNATFN